MGQLKSLPIKKAMQYAGDEDLEFYEGDYINEDSENHMDEDDTEE